MNNKEKLAKQHQKILTEDKNKNGKPDFFEDTPLNIIKKLIRLAQKKDPNIAGNPNDAPSIFTIIAFVFLLGIILVAVAFYAFPLLFFAIPFILNKKNKKDSSSKKVAEKDIVLSQKSPSFQNTIPPSPLKSNSNNIQNNFSEAFRIILFIGAIVYLIYYFWPYISDKIG